MGEKLKPDFSGYATKAGLKCSDGRTIMPDAFKHQDTMTVPLVWLHGHSEQENILGHAVLENRADGVYTYGYFNSTKQAENAKELVKHGDIQALSIFANQLKEKASNVIHGMIREVSLVLAGANPGALIDNVSMAHGDGITILEDEAVIYTGLEFAHADSEGGSDAGNDDEGDETGDEGDGQTVQDVYESMSPEQQEVVHVMVGHALESSPGEPSDTPSNNDAGAEHSATGDQGKEVRRMSRNVFEKQNGGSAEGEKHTLTHDAMRGIAADAVKRGSLKDAVEAYSLQHGINDIDILFPDAKNVDQTPQFDQRRVEWVSAVWNGTRKSPFSRIKSIVADITQDEARAKGYIKGRLKKEEWFGLTKRTTGPKTVYKKQSLDRDDIIDITDFDVVIWLKSEMRLMLEEEIAGAILIGDGREVDDEDKITDPAAASDGNGIRSILNEADLYAATIEVNIRDANSSYSEVIDAVTRSMKFYKGSGAPTLFTTFEHLTEMLLLKDGMDRRLYRTRSDLAAELGVSDIVEVEVMDRVPDVIGIIVNLKDYTIGTDKGGETTFFDDFDIDYNKYKYLYEARLSGALTKIRSALILKRSGASEVLVDPTDPTFVKTTGVITIPSQTGVVYKRADTNATLSSGAQTALAAGASLKVYAVPASGYFFADNIDDNWTFKRNAS